MTDCRIMDNSWRFPTVSIYLWMKLSKSFKRIDQLDSICRYPAFWMLCIQNTWTLLGSFVMYSSNNIWYIVTDDHFLCMFSDRCLFSLGNHDICSTRNSEDVHWLLNVIFGCLMFRQMAASVVTFHHCTNWFFFAHSPNVFVSFALLIG